MSYEKQSAYLLSIIYNIPIFVTNVKNDFIREYTTPHYVITIIQCNKSSVFIMCETCSTCTFISIA